MDIHWHKSLGSTNDEAKRLAKEGAPHGTLVGADFQNQGRGRSGKTWQCQPGEGLMCSVILRPQWDIPYWGWIALTAGLAVSELLERDCLHPKIKYPNDLLVNGKKIAGILTEADDKAVVVGIGMNLNMSVVPEVESEIKPTSFFLETDCKLEAASYARSIQSTLVNLISAESPLLLRGGITRRLAWYAETVSLNTKTETLKGEITGLGEYGQLLLHTGAEQVEVYDAFQIRSLN